ncbi:MAG: amidase [Beijerinckiaceae bacterium]
MTAFEPWLKAFAYLPTSVEIPNAGPLAGIPVGIKDLIATSDMPTTYGSPIYADHVPGADAWVVERLRGLGAIIFGKTVTTEFAFRSPGPTVNPWNRDHTPGGSSSGSAAAVAAGLVPLALGTQTLGSVIRPAAFNGIVGLKPSFGAIPRTGIHPLATSLDHVGLFARRVDDVAYGLSLLAAVHDSDRHGLALPGFALDIETGLTSLDRPRFALVRTRLWDRVQPAQIKAFDHAIERMCAAGGSVNEITLPAAYDEIGQLIETILASEAAPTFRPLIERFPDRTSTHLQELVARGQAIAEETYIKALRAQADLRKDLSLRLDGFDAILTVPATGEAPEGLNYTGDPSFCMPWTFLGVPAVTIPAGFGPRGLPLGLQVVGRYREDIKTLRAAKFAETALALPQRLPKSSLEHS